MHQGERKRPGGSQYQVLKISIRSAKLRGMDRWPIVGRTEELRFISNTIADPGRSGVLVAGQAGVGKTRLLREVVSTTSDQHVEWITASESVRPLPFGALAQLLPNDLNHVDQVDLLKFPGPASTPPRRGSADRPGGGRRPPARWPVCRFHRLRGDQGDRHRPSDTSQWILRPGCTAPTLPRRRNPEVGTAGPLEIRVRQDRGGGAGRHRRKRFPRAPVESNPRERHSSPGS